MTSISRTRSRKSGKKDITFDYAGYGPQNDIVVYSEYELLDDSVSFNNPRNRKGTLLRPPQACRHIVHQTQSDYHTVFSGDGYQITHYSPDSSVFNGFRVLEDHLLNTSIDQELYNLVNKMEKKFRPLDESFNLFNFIYELKDVASLLDPAKAVWKRIDPTSKRQAKKIKRALKDGADDIASTYVNTQFGYVPTISDGFTIFSRLKGIDTSFQELKQALKPRRSRFSKTIPINVRLKDLGGPNGNAITTYDLIFIGTAKLSVQARCTFQMDMLESLGPLLASIQKGGLAKFNLATIWNFVPFSWAVDWLLPIGDALDNLSGDPLGIVRTVSGTMTYHIEGNWTIPRDSVNVVHPVPLYPWPEHPILDVTGKLSIYNRNPVPSSLEAYRHPPFKLGKLDLRKLLISTSIIKPW